MSKEIPGVPEKFTREQYISLFEAVGLEPRQVFELSFRSDGVYATLFAQNENGNKVLDGDSFAKHVIYIPVVD